LAQRDIHVCWGASVHGLEKIDPGFVERTRKDALYFAQPNFFPPTFERFKCGSIEGHIWSVMFISSAEYAFLQTEGPSAFEMRLQQANVDPFILYRPSAL